MKSRMSWLDLAFWTLAVGGVALLSAEAVVVAWALFVWGAR